MNDAKEMAKAVKVLAAVEARAGIKSGNLSEEHDDGDSDEGGAPDFKSAFMSFLAPELPPNVKRRVKALKKIQLESVNIEAKFFEEIHALETKYLELYRPQYIKRASIVTGEYEPTEEECDWHSDTEDEDTNLSKDANEKLNIKEIQAQQDANDAKGIPDFWLTIFRNVSILSEMVEEYDVPILKHLKDITVDFTDSPMGFVLHFHFAPNEFFTNTILTKEYELKCVPDTDDPFSFEGPEIIRCKGCPIEWSKGKNVTVKTLKKKQKHKGRGEMRTVTKTVKRDSFFNFFAPPLVDPNPDAEIDDDVQALLTTDFEIGHYIREQIVPRAVLYFTGEALDEEDEEEEEGEDEEDEDEEEDEDDDEELVSKNNRTNAKAPKLTTNNGQNPAECKQQ